MTFSERIAVLATTRTLGHGIDLQRSIDTVSGIRKRYSVMHELGHYELSFDDAPPFIPAAALTQRAGHVNRSHKANRPNVSVWPADSAAPRFVSNLHEVNHFRVPKALRPSRDDTGDMMQQGLLQVAQPLSLAERLILQRGSRTMRVRLHSCALLADDWLAYVSLMDNLLTRFHLERALQFAALHRRSVPTIVLVLLAVCRRYGHRAEPDDHSLLQRHQPTFRGVACTVS